MSIAIRPPERRSHPLVRTAALGAAACLYVALATIATIREPDGPEPPCWYE
ncbi:hypothetical protein [Halomarina litorea]|uniref:hypothetical protein n=1 Tax=Halomarina litorea TaxID=2961595 RepID=UPI0020C3B5D8|nr:hypothetical protein [Halomarina sp. BCD28]